MTLSSAVLDAAIAATVVGLLAWLAAVALRRASAALRHTIWRAALAAFSLAPMMAVAADALHWEVPLLRTRMTAVVEQSEADLTLRGGAVRRPFHITSSPRAPADQGPSHTPRPLRYPSTLTLVLSLWAAGAGLSGLSVLRNLRAVRRLLRSVSPVGETVLRQRVAEWCARMGLAKPVRLASSPAVTVPTVAGWRVPVLLLPPGFSCDDSSCDPVVVHELAHISRRDLAWQAAARIIRALWWWHPLAWVSARELGVSAEQACDDWAIALTGQRRAYANHLVRWAEAAGAGSPVAYAYRGEALVRRVGRILAETDTPRLGGSRRSRTTVAACAVAAIFAAALLRAQPAPPKSATHEENGPMGTLASAYGFRYDPMGFVEKDRTLQGALVRRIVFERPHEGDAALLQKRIDEILAEQEEDGTFKGGPEGNTSKTTGARVVELLQLGLAADSPEMQRAGDAILRQKRAGQNANEWYEKEGALAWSALEALCLLGRRDEPEVPFSLHWFVEHPKEWNDAWKGCPWTPEVFWGALWAGREFAEVEPTVNDGLRRIAQGINAAGCDAYKDPWGFTEAAGEIETPEARALVEKQIPMILRGQRSDGGWGDHSLAVFRALKAHGFLEPLRKAPPLPPDWRIVRSIPAPEGDLFTMTWDGQRIWVYDRKANVATAVSPEDGQVVKTLALPGDKVFGIAWWDDGLAVTQTEPKRLLQVDPDSGRVTREISLDAMRWVHGAAQVGGAMWVGDGFMCHVSIVDLSAGQLRGAVTLAGPGPSSLAAQDGAVWHCDFWAPAIIKSDLSGILLDWGEKPFEGSVEGLAWDGEHLWALDNAQKRICVIEKRQDSEAGA